MNKGRLAFLIRLSYLPPEIVGALLAGRHPIELTPMTAILRAFPAVSLFFRKNSLLSLKKFPVLFRREFACKTIEFTC
jgi:hypothetical protein